MIYRVVLDDIYDMHTSNIDCMLLNPSLELEMNSAGSFKFTLPPTHPNWDDVKVLKSTIDVYENNELIFTGRVASIEKNWNNERVVECEGALAYFNDSVHRQNKWGTPLPIAVDPDDQPADPAEHIRNFLEDILNNHNAFVGDQTKRQIFMGHIYVNPEYVTREVDYDTTLDILTRMCIDTNGGYFQVRKDPEDGKLYLDWLKEFTDESGQPASFGLNLLDFNTSLSAEDICTGVLARGATVNDQVVTLNDVELVDEETYPDMSVSHYTTHDQDILWHREGMEMFGQVVQVKEFSDAQTAWKDQQGHVVANSLFEMAKKWLEEKNTKVETIEVDVAELAWLQDGVPQYKLGQIVEVIDSVHMTGESEETRKLPMYKMSCDLTSGSKKVTLGTPPKKELTQISASNSDSSTLSSTSSSGSSGGGSGSGEECKVTDVRVDGTSVVSNKVANISLTGKADASTVNALAATVANKADTSTVTALANVVATKQNQIEFNTQEAATETLNRLKADGKVYNLGGGTEVVANPSGAATDDLETIQIGNTVYDIPGSTNYGKFKCDVLFNTPTSSSGWSNPITICTKSVVEEYDVLVLTYGVTQQETATVLVADLLSNQNDKYYYLPTTNANGGNFHISGLRIDSNNNLLFNVDVNGDYLYKVYGLKFENKLINRSDIYSEEERMIGRWTDGKPLYQKTVNWDSVPSGRNDNLAHNIPDVDHIHITEWLFANSIVGHETADQSYWAQIFFVNPTYVGYRFGQGWGSNLPLQITFQYTKTTDSADSGVIPEDPQFVMMSDIYSEDEQVVGRWTDGKPLYQKTFKNLGINLPASTWTNTGISFSDIDYYKVVTNKSYLSDAQSQYPMLYRYYQGTFQAFCQYAMPLNELTIQYTKLTDTPGTGPTPGNLIYLPALYSEEEREVGVWTDGKPLYQKTWTGLNINVTNDWTSTGITISDIDDIILTTGTRIDTQCTLSLNAVIQSGGVIKISKDTTGYTGVNSLTLQYTKTTDQPGSGKYLPDGQLAHHYSTSEKVVGTWIDGSTIYERTITGFSVTLQSGSARDTGVNISYVSKLISVNALGNDDISVLPVAGYKINNTLQILGYQTGNVINCAIIQYTKSS